MSQQLWMLRLYQPIAGVDMPLLDQGLSLAQTHHAVWEIEQTRQPSTFPCLFHKLLCLVDE